MPEQVGLFCGTFNPIHLGHLLIAESAREQFDLSKVIFVTSASPPHRKAGLLEAHARHEMVEAAILGNPFFEASTLELNRPGPSYTVDTAREVQALYGEGANINLIVGSDNLPSLGGWHEADKLIRLVRILVAPRVTEGQRFDPRDVIAIKQRCPGLKGADLDIIAFPAIAISSSSIRRRLSQGFSVLYMVPAEVNEIILAKDYYQDWREDAPR
jgi:nicotinate-nucleotide adenylyltransferase